MKPEREYHPPHMKAVHVLYESDLNDAIRLSEEYDSTVTEVISHSISAFSYLWNSSKGTSVRFFVSNKDLFDEFFDSFTKHDDLNSCTEINDKKVKVAYNSVYKVQNELERIASYEDLYAEDVLALSIRTYGQILHFQSKGESVYKQTPSGTITELSFPSPAR